MNLKKTRQVVFLNRKQSSASDGQILFDKILGVNEVLL